MLWHCSACNYSGEIFLKRIFVTQFEKEHRIASPHCSKPKIRIRESLTVEEERKIHQCKQCGHEISKHATGSVEGKAVRQHCWHGRSLRPGSIGVYLHTTEDILSGKVKDKNLCRCTGYVRPKIVISHYNRDRSRWWRGSIEQGHH